MAIQNRRKSIKVTCAAMKVVTAEYTVHKVRSAAMLFFRQHGMLPQTINGRKVVGACSRSGRIVMDGDDYTSSSEPLCLVLKKEKND